EKKIPADQWADKKNRVLVNRESLVEYLSLQSANEGTREFLGSKSNYPITSGLRADMYRCFMEQTWGHLSTLGVVALIHPESHFTDDKATRLRRETYLRLRQHWQFINELQLFSEIAHIFSYGVHVYKIRREEHEFVTASSIYHPSTVERSLLHDGSGPPPGIRNQEGYWDLSPHASRIVRVDRERLASWGKFLNNDSNISPLETSSIFLVNQEVFGVINALSESGRIGELSPSFSQGWNETTDFKKGRFKKAWGSSCGWDEVIIQGPNIHVSTPIYKFPNSTMNSHGDWHYVDLEQLNGSTVPVTSYKPIRDGQYDQLYTHWTLPNGERVSARDYYRIAWRRMAANTGERTLIPAIIPPGASHMHLVYSLAFPIESDYNVLLASQGVLSSMLSDFSVRSVPKSDIIAPVVERMAFPPSDHDFGAALNARVLMLTSLTEAYADLWNSTTDLTTSGQTWTGSYGFPDSVSMDVLDYEWSESSPLRLAADRRQAQVEIDALVALMLGVTADELCSIYRTQFPVLYKYDTQRDHFDQNGRLVPAEVLKTCQKLGEAATLDDLTAANAQGFTYTYAPPFATLDREADMRTAYAEFEQRLADREKRTSESAEGGAS